MKVKYLLFVADFDETESDVVKLCSDESVRDYFCDDASTIANLFSNGSHYGEWHQYHLVKLEDYQ